MRRHGRHLSPRPRSPRISKQWWNGITRTMQNSALCVHVSRHCEKGQRKGEKPSHLVIFIGEIKQDCAVIMRLCVIPTSQWYLLHIYFLLKLNSPLVRHLRWKSNHDYQLEHLVMNGMRKCEQRSKHFQNFPSIKTFVFQKWLVVVKNIRFH